MIDNMGMIMGHLKIEEMRRSETFVPHDDAQNISEQATWLSQQTGRVIYALGNQLISLGKLMKHQPKTLHEIAHRRQE